MILILQGVLGSAFQKLSGRVISLGALPGNLHRGRQAHASSIFPLPFRVWPKRRDIEISINS